MLIDVKSKKKLQKGKVYIVDKHGNACEETTFKEKQRQERLNNRSNIWPFCDMDLNDER